MSKKELSISVVVPFYNGNKYINELLESVELVAQNLSVVYKLFIEVVIINDSPDISVEYVGQKHINIHIICNDYNIGIHGSRVNGIKNAKGEWIIFLDQDDLLIPQNYIHQINAIEQSDVVVGNGYYYFGENKQKIFFNKQVMNYLIQETKMIGIRNLIPSPGECIIKKDKIPAYWLQNTLKCNGSDDWLLWLLLFDSNAVFAFNVTPVYIHRNSAEGNLSFDLKKMNKSSEEMCKILYDKPSYARSKIKTLERAIKFKFMYDTKSLKPADILFFYDRFLDNVAYKLKVKSLMYYRGKR